MIEPTHNIDIQIQTHYLEDQSDPDQDRYAFAYTIRIANTGRVPAQLISRRWLITDARGQVQHVEGEGVVGEQPRIAPGEAFEYTSGAVLETDVGTMEGAYQMVTDEGSSFEAPIPRFTLSVPRTLH